MPVNRDVYRNPGPPPGYVHMQRPEIKLKEKFRLIDGVCCEFLGLIIDSGAFDLDSPPDAFIICSDEEDVLELPPEQKEPIFIDLVDDEDFPADVEVNGLRPPAVEVPSITEGNELSIQEKNENIKNSKSPVKTNQIKIKKEPANTPNTGIRIEFIKTLKKKNYQNNTILKSPVKTSQINEKNESQDAVIKNDGFVKHIQERNNQNITNPKSPVKINKVNEKSASQKRVMDESQKRVVRDELLKKIKKRIAKEIESKNTSVKKDAYLKKKPSHRIVRKQLSPVREQENSPESVERYDVSPKRKTSKREKHEEYTNDDNSTHSSNYPRKKAKKEDKAQCSDSENSADEDKKFNIKREPFDILHGYYYCQLCKAEMTSEVTFETHLNGKRHLKNLKLKNVADTVAKTVPPFQVLSNYPPPPPGVYRMKCAELSAIQNIVEHLKIPSPGLDRVIEIQGLNETSYYCEMCAAPCGSSSIIPHLTGFRHQLESLKYFDYDKYVSVRDRKKREAERIILKCLHDIERIQGRGLITVEREFIGKDEMHKSNIRIKTERSRREAIAGPSHRPPELPLPPPYTITIEPDTSKSDYYCKLCDSHMNNVNMWNQHIIGKRHMANLKKAPGELPSKTKTVLIPHERALIMDELDRITQPVVGLGDMREIRNPEAQGEMYNCYLCGACLTSMDVIEHILSLKHRKKYLEKINHPDIQTVNEMDIHDSHMIGVITETCYHVQQELGRGKMEVHITKNAVTSRW